MSATTYAGAFATVMLGLCAYLFLQYLGVTGYRLVVGTLLTAAGYGWLIFHLLRKDTP